MAIKRKTEKKPEKEKFYDCTRCKKACIPAAFIKSKGEKERCYCKACLQELVKPGEF